MKVAEVYHFDEYAFNDTGDIAVHPALIVFPGHHQYVQQVYTCVITSQEPRDKRFTIDLDKAKYSYISQNYKAGPKTSFVCFDRLDIQSVGSGNRKRLGLLLNDDAKRGFEIIKKCINSGHVNYSDQWLKAAILRAWSKHLSILGSTK